MLGYYIRSCHVVMCNMRETWDLFYLRKMRTLPTTCHMLPHVQWHHGHIVWHAHAGKLATPIIHGVPGISYGHAVHASQMIFTQNNQLTF